MTRAFGVAYNKNMPNSNPTPPINGATVLPPVKVFNPAPVTPPAPAAAPVAPTANTGAPVTSLSQIIAYSKANPTSQYAKQAYTLIKSGAFDQQAQKEGVDLSWAGRPKLTDTTAQTDSEGQDQGQEEAPKPTLGDLDMQQLQGAAQKIIDSVQNAGTKEQHDANGTIFGEAKGVGDVLEGLLGAGSGIVQGVTAPVSAVLQKALTYDPAAAKPGQADIDPAGARTDAAGQQFAAAHPELVQNLRDAVNVGGALYGGAEGLIPGGDMTLGDLAATGKGVLTDAADRIKAAAPAIKEVAFPSADTKIPTEEATPGAGAAKSVVKSATASAMGVQPSTIDQIFKNPDLFTPEKMSEASRQNLAEEAAAGINKKVADLEKMKAETGVSPRALADQVDTGIKLREHKLEQAAKSYGGITGDRTPGSTEGPNIKVAKNWLDKQVEKVTGRTVKNGRIDPSPSSAAALRQPKDINTLQKFLDTHRPAFQTGKLSGNEFLNIRDDLDTNLANFDNGGTPSSDLQKTGKNLYSNLNDSYRGRFPGLEKADAEYAEQKNDLDRLKVGLIDNQGNLSENAMTRIRNAVNGDKNDIGSKLEEIVPGIKARVQKLNDIEAEQTRYRSGIVDQTGHLLDGAANRIANAGGVGKDLLSSRLEEVAPGIGDKAKYIKAVEDIQSAKGIKTGTYLKAGLTLLNGPFGIASLILTHPDVAVPLLRKFGASTEDATKIATDLGVGPKK